MLTVLGNDSILSQNPLLYSGFSVEEMRLRRFREFRWPEESINQLYNIFCDIRETCKVFSTNPSLLAQSSWTEYPIWPGSLTPLHFKLSLSARVARSNIHFGSLTIRAKRQLMKCGSLAGVWTLPAVALCELRRLVTQ